MYGTREGIKVPAILQSHRGSPTLSDDTAPRHQNYAKDPHLSRTLAAHETRPASRICFKLPVQTTILALFF